MNQTPTEKRFRTSAEILSQAHAIVYASQSTKEAITKLEKLIDTTAHCTLTARELLSFYQ